MTIVMYPKPILSSDRLLRSVDMPYTSIVLRSGFPASICTVPYQQQTTVLSHVAFFFTASRLEDAVDVVNLVFTRNNSAGNASETKV